MANRHGDVAEGADGEVQEYRESPRLLGPLVPATMGYAATGLEPRIHRGLPSPLVTLIFSLDGPVVTGESSAQAYGPDAARHDVMIGGLVTRPAYVVQPERQAGIQLAVHPLAARAVFGLPASELALLATDGQDVLGSEVRGVLDQLSTTAGWTARFDLLGRYLRDRVQERRAGRPRSDLVEAWTWLDRRGGTGSMDALARHVHLSGRQLRTLFQREVGMGPKQVSRLLRFDRAKHLIARTVAAGRPLELAAVAVRTGYYDHAHLDRDFAALAGISPTSWVAEERRNIQAGGHGAGAESGHDDSAADRPAD